MNHEEHKELEGLTILGLIEDSTNYTHFTFRVLVSFVVENRRLILILSCLFHNFDQHFGHCVRVVSD